MPANEVVVWRTLSRASPLLQVKSSCAVADHTGGMMPPRDVSFRVRRDVCDAVNDRSPQPGAYSANRPPATPLPGSQGRVTAARASPHCDRHTLRTFILLFLCILFNPASPSAGCVLSGDGACRSLDVHCRASVQAPASRQGRHSRTGTAHHRPDDRINDNGIMPIESRASVIRRLIKPQGSPDRAG